MAEQIWITEVFDNLRGIDDMAWELIGLSKAFGRTGNHEVAIELREYSENMRQSTKAISGAISKYLHDKVGKDQKAITETLTVLMGGKPNG